MSSFLNNYKELVDLTESWLHEFLESEPLPSRLGDVYGYCLTSPGKRIRPTLVLAAADMLEVPRGKLKSYVVAIELIHTASLIHDDLPALDDDSLRRGQPTCHVEFSESSALLTGDAMIAHAFQLIADDKELKDSVKIGLISLLSKATVEICDGQVMDVEAGASEGSEEELELRHQKKTAALFSAALCAPTCFLPEEEAQHAAAHLRELGKQLGLLFQITDDLLDATASTEQLGKDADSDKRCGTPTYVSVLGMELAKERAQSACSKALKAIGPFGHYAEFIREMCEFVRTRER